MARKTFISYKYNEAKAVRDRIIRALGDNATFYKGETRESPDMNDLETDTIRRKLRDMMYDTSVTIVVLSPNMIESKWIDWEIEYTLKQIQREERTSRTNGIVAVVMKVDGSYDWLIGSRENSDGCSIRTINNERLYKIISDNRFNLVVKKYHCDNCKTSDQLNGSYISIIEEDRFIKNHDKFIENAYEKSLDINNFNLVKTRN